MCSGPCLSERCCAVWCVDARRFTATLRGYGSDNPERPDQARRLSASGGASIRSHMRGATLRYAVHTWAASRLSRFLAVPPSIVEVAFARVCAGAPPVRLDDRVCQSMGGPEVSVATHHCTMFARAPAAVKVRWAPGRGVAIASSPAVATFPAYESAHSSALSHRSQAWRNLRLMSVASRRQVCLLPFPLGPDWIRGDILGEHARRTLQP